MKMTISEWEGWKQCPHCGEKTDTISDEHWTTFSNEDPGNKAQLIEYLCRNEPCSRSFWI